MNIKDFKTYDGNSIFPYVNGIKVDYDTELINNGYIVKEKNHRLYCASNVTKNQRENIERTLKEVDNDYIKQLDVLQEKFANKVDDILKAYNCEKYMWDIKSIE